MYIEPFTNTAWSIYCCIHFYSHNLSDISPLILFTMMARACAQWVRCWFKVRIEVNIEVKIVVRDRFRDNYKKSEKETTSKTSAYGFESFLLQLLSVLTVSTKLSRIF